MAEESVEDGNFATAEASDHGDACKTNVTKETPEKADTKAKARRSSTDIVPTWEEIEVVH